MIDLERDCKDCYYYDKNEQACGYLGICPLVEEDKRLHKKEEKK